MGNTNARESRSGDGERRPAPDTLAAREANGRSRNRMSRGDISFLTGMSTGSGARDRDREAAPYERRETRQEREARRLERERVARLKERERSMREEHVDGGYLVTLGTYTGIEDFSKPTVRQLQIERKLAPFWRGLNDWSSSWAEHQLVAAARDLPIPPADAPPDPDLMPQPLPANDSQNIQNLTVPMGARTLSAASDHSATGNGSGAGSPAATGAQKSSGAIKPRAKAIAAALSVGSRNASSTDLTPKEISLSHDPFVNGQPIEVYLYKDADDCPICFLSYPPYLNSTRCCDQAICSECFVQIKRAEPHLPEHHPNGEARDPNEGPAADEPPERLISEPSACPYCQQPEFGVTYDPPPFRRGLIYSSSSSNLASTTAMSSQTSLHSTGAPNLSPQANRKRGHSLSANAPNVITTDRVRPDWATKLAAARSHQARRAAAATALHTAAFLVGGGEQRSILRGGRFSRRGTGNNSAGAETPVGNPRADNGGPVDEQVERDGQSQQDGNQRNRMEELEDMMFMEAVRLSLAAEEDRKRKEEKAIRKEAKKREQAERKALKKQSKNPYGTGVSSASGSSLSLGLGRLRGNSGTSNLRVEATVQGASQVSKDATSAAERDQRETSQGDDEMLDKGKGKEIEHGEQESIPGGPSSASEGLPIPSTGTARNTSHLRQMSNASSIGSSAGGTPSGSYTGPGFAGAEGGREGDQDSDGEPLYNFRSLAELIGVNLEDGSAKQQDEEADSAGGRPLSQVKEDAKEEAEAEHVEQSVTNEVIPRPEAIDSTIATSAIEPSNSESCKDTTSGASMTQQSTLVGDVLLSEDKLQPSDVHNPALQSAQ